MAKKTKVTAAAATEEKESINIVILGSSATGKTALATTYLFNVFQAHHTPTFDGVFTRKWRGARPQALTVLEPGCEARLSARLCSTPIDVFLIAFSLVDQRTLHDVTDMWAPLARDTNKDPPIPIVLVGCKKDLRPPTLLLDSTQRSEVLEDEGSKASWKIGAKAYIECSAMTHEGVDEVFNEAMTVGGWTVPDHTE